MTTLQKPDAFSPSGWVHSPRLPTELVNELLDMFPKKMQSGQRSAFLRACAEAAQVVNERRIVDGGAAQLTQLRNVAASAATLLTRLTELQPEAINLFSANLDDSAYFGEPIATLSDLSKAVIRADDDGRFLGTVWDVVADLAAVAAYTVAHNERTKSEKPSELNARYLVWLILSSHKAIFGKLPSLGKTAWFPPFIERLGKWPGLRLSCGVTLVKGVVENQFPVNPD